MKFNKHFFGALAASALVLTTACSSEEGLRAPEASQSEVYGTGSNVVTLTLSPEATTATSRAASECAISDGSHANILIFAVYEVTVDETSGAITSYTLAPQFKKENTATLGTVTLGEGQNAVDVTSWPIRLQFATDPAKKYVISFWAQNNTTNAFNTTDLKNVIVDYDGAKNNDELRDAFCKTSDVINGDTKQTTEVILHRPFAQINVGTSGADYNHLLNSVKVYPNKAIKYSKIVLKGVANKIDVVTDEISTVTGDKNFEGNVTFDWAALPAYHTLDEIPTTTADILEKTGESFLKVRLNESEVNFEGMPEKDENGLFVFKTEYPTRQEGDNGAYLTETFKYLSMCYVLVPASTNPDKAETVKGGEKSYASSVLSEVSVWFAETETGKDYVYKEKDPNAPADGESADPETVAAFSYLTLKNVPVHRNWRTNILGGLKFTKDDDPDDETSLFSLTKVCVHLCPIFDGEYTNINSTTTWMESEFPHGEDSWHWGPETDHPENSGAADEEPGADQN